MRLLELKNYDEFSLTKDLIDNIPPYVILSHTWGEDNEEVTFDDLVTGAGKSKAGYKKIQFCREQAATDGFQYFWVDTCCINKSSSAELSEAINSMFRWYHDAAKCYVYLSDVSTYGFDANDQSFRSAWESAFRESRWFTRGWTLQELIAPASVEFFSLEGKRLGNKESVELLVHEITGIPIEVLQGSPLAQYTIDERMLWAAKRTTKRKEDEAYCLFGIFDIYMPPIYGEGRKKAFIRLEEEVDKHTRGARAPSHGNKHWIVPRTINDLFTGRTELLLRMQKALHSDNTSCADKQKRFVVTGLGGQGKSEICLKVASLMREKFWGVFWVDVGRPSIAEKDFIAIAKILGHSVGSIHEALQVLANANQSWLLILDNADDPDFDYQDFLPSGTQGAIIITSRIPECRQYSPGQAEALEGLEDQDSKELLLKAAELPRESWPSYGHPAEEVVHLLGSHTLALIQAGAYVAQGHCQLHQYPEVYRRQRKRLLKYRPKQGQSRYCDVYATFEASADVLERSESEAAKDALRLLEILSMLDSGVLPLQIFHDAWDGCREILCTNRTEASGIEDLSMQHLSQLPSFIEVGADEWDPYRLVEAGSLLGSLSLVTRHNSGGLSGLSMHPLTHAWAKDRQDSEQQGVAWIAAGCVLAFSRSNNHTWQTQERRLLSHVQSYLDIEISKAVSFGSKGTVLFVPIVPILFKCGQALLYMRQDSRVGHLLEDMFMELGKNSQEPSKEILPLYDLQAQSLLYLGKDKKAVELLEQIVKIRETTQAADHPDRLDSQHMLAVAYQANGQVKEAVELLEQVVKIQETTLAIDHPDQLGSQHALAIAYQANGRVKEAVELLEQVVKIRETTLAANHPNRLASQYALALAYKDNGQIEEAIELLEQVVKIRETTLAADHPDRLTSQHTLALAYQANGQVEEAVKLLEQVVKIRETTLATDHPDQLSSQHALALAYWANGQAKHAVELLEQVAKIRETTLAIDHPDQLSSQHALAIVYQANGQVKEAVELLGQVVKIRETTLATDHPNRLASQHALALAYQANRQVKEAIELLEQVVKIKQSKLRESHPSRVVSEKALAYCLQNR